MSGDSWPMVCLARADGAESERVEWREAYLHGDATIRGRGRSPEIFERDGKSTYVEIRLYQAGGQLICSMPLPKPVCARKVGAVIHVDGLFLNVVAQIPNSSNAPMTIEQCEGIDP